jgi:signal peptidase I
MGLSDLFLDETGKPKINKELIKFGALMVGGVLLVIIVVLVIYYTSSESMTNTSKHIRNIVHGEYIDHAPRCYNNISMYANNK